MVGIYALDGSCFGVVEHSIWLEGVWRFIDDSMSLVVADVDHEHDDFCDS